MRKLLIEAVEEMTPEQRNRLERNFREGYMRNEAGTDHPMYVDLTNNIVISGDYEDGDARPFAYFPVDPNEELEFFIKEYGDYSDDIQTHGDLFGEAFYQYVYNFIWRNFADKEIAFLEKMKEFGDIVKEENLKYSRWDRSFVNVDTGKNINFVDFLTNLFSELTIPVEVTSQMSHLYAEFFDEYNWETYDFIEGITDYINNSDWSYYDSSDQELIALAVGIGDLDKIYNISRFEGRIWDEGRLITFYPGQQPSRHELPGILKDICRDGGHTVDELGDFYIIFETGSKEAYTGTGYKSHKDATVKCCLIKDYLQGNYEGYDAKAEADMVKNRKGISGFCPHLANQKDKFNFFKAFRSNRDRAVFVPREKGAGTLAAYHAMRYPFGEEKKVNGNELNESSRKYNEAGTDHPFYRDKVTGKEFEANWNDGDGFPFGYWPVDSEGNKEFCVADYGETHAQACGIAARKYFYDKINDIAYDAADEICSALHDFFQGFNERGYKYNEEEGMYVSADGEDKLDIDNCIDQVMDYVYNDFPESYTVVHDFMEEFLTDGTVPSFDDVQEKLLENVDDYSFYERDDIDRALELVGTNFSDFFEEGRSQGRIWPDKEMIGFYDVAQPTPEEMEEIIYDLGEYMGEPYEYFMNFHYIYEDWDDDDYLIKMTTIDNFINSDVEKADKQYAKDGKAVFVPHLANQQDKFNFFKGFRDTRDRAVFAPREKGAGTLAAYHAMRYPYGEERDVNGNLIREEYQRSNEAGTDCPYFYDPETGFEIEGTNDDEDACPFGYFPYEVGSNDLKFFCCEDCEDVESPIHRDIVNSIIMNSINEIIDELTENDEEIIPYLRDLKNDIPSKFDFPKILTEIFEDAGVSYKPTEEFANHLYKYLGMNNWSDDVLGGWLFKDLYDEIYDYWAGKDEYQIQMGYDFGVEYGDILYSGRLLGRMWPDKGLITFYPGQQPSREEMKMVITDISSRMGIEYEDLLKFYTIFEIGSKEVYTGTGYKGHDDATVQCCTIAEYIEGKYNGFNREEEVEMVKNRKGIDQLNIHLANQKDKFDYFKNFRDTRDRAVYAPREKGAGTLAAYHAMRYPFGENRVIKEDYRYNSNDASVAGTDWPYFYDEKRGRAFEGDWRSKVAYPFGYFEVSKGKLEFFVGKGCSTHGGIAFEVAKDYYLPNETTKKLGEVAKSIVEGINSVLSGDKEQYELLIKDQNSPLFKAFRRPLYNRYHVLLGPITERKIISDVVLNREHCNPEYIQKLLFNAILDYCIEDSDKDDPRPYDLDELFEFTDLRGGEYYFDNGRMQGRIFTDNQTISFYDEQQPNSKELDIIIKKLSEKLNISYDDLMEYEIIYRNWDETYEDEDGYDMGVITGCSVYEYITGKPMDDMINPEERKGSKFVPHLASPDEKFNFFKGFRDTRDRAVYAPREKGAGTLAGYHAMRYPFGESRKKKLLGLVNEEINKMLNEGIQLLREGNGSRAKRQTIAIIADSLGFDADSPYAIDMENRLKTIFFHHGLDCDRYIVFEPNICRCALDLGFGTNDFTGEDEKYISKVLDLIYKHIEVIENDKARQAELKRIKDSITGIDALTAIDKQLQAEFPVNNEQPVENAKEDERIVNNLANGYHREGPLTYEMAGEYGQYSNPEGRICFTYQPEQWRAYSKGGMNTCYVLLRDDWKKWNNIKPEHDGSEKNCILGEPFNKQNGYDDYGMSMIFIFVNPQGNLETANGRWNHGANWPAGYRCDHEYTEDDITKLIGQQFKNVFKSTYNFNELLAKALEKLNNGESPAKAFNYATGMYNFGGKEYCTVKLAEMYNILFDGKIVSPKWFDKITHTFNHLGLASGVIGGVNYIFDTNGKRYKFSDISQIINKKLMNGEDPGNIFFGHNFKNDKGFAVVSILGKYNILSLTANKLISNIWFDDISSTRTGLFHCSINRKNYLLLLDGKIVSEEKALTTFLYNIENYPELCRHDYDVNDETFCVEIFGNFYYVRNSDKKPINTKGFRRIEKQSNSRFVWCHNYNANPAQDEKYALDLKTGKLMLEDEFFSYIWKAAGINPDAAEEKYFENIEPAGEGIFRIYFRGRGWNYIKDGKLMFKVWFNKCGGFENGIAKVYNNTWQWRVVNTNGEFVTPNGFLNLEIHGKYLVGYDEDDNEDYDGENDEYVEYFSVIDLSTKREIYDYARLSDSRNLSHTTLGEKFITDDDEIFLVFTKDGEMLTDDEYEALISETYERTRDLSLFDTVTDMKYGYKKVKAVYNWFNMLDKNGNLVFNEWIWMLRDFEDGRLKVEFAKHFNYLDENLRPILPNNHNYSWGDEFHCGFARVRDKDTHREYFIDVNGNIAFDKNGYEYCWEFNPNTKLARVKIDGVYYDMTTNGKLMKRD